MSYTPPRQRTRANRLDRNAPAVLSILFVTLIVVMILLLGREVAAYLADLEAMLGGAA